MPQSDRSGPVRLWQLLSTVLVVVAAGLLLGFVDLSPEVGKSFFFAGDDPRFVEDQQIEEAFPQPPQVYLSVASSQIGSTEYIQGIGELSEDLRGVEGVVGVQDLLQGPDEVADAFENPLWQRLLIAEGGGATYVIVFLQGQEFDRVVPEIEAVVDRHQGPDFRIAIAGVPFAMEVIRRGLARDMVVFGLGAVFVFGLVAALYYRSAWIVAGTLLASGLASLLTLLVRPLLGMQVDILTPNITTIVFVLTLSHIVFLTANWRAAGREGDVGTGDAVRTAVRWTAPASFWAMATTGLGFSTLLLATAEPLRNFGLSCAVGAVLAFGCAYAVFPAFLHPADPARGGKGRIRSWISAAFEQRLDWAAAGLLVLALAAIPGLLRLETDPDLISYFAEGSEIRDGLERVDREGGSSPLYLVIRDSEGRQLTDNAVVDRMWALQESFEADPAVGVVISLPVLLAEADEAVPFFIGWFLGWEDYLERMEESEHADMTRAFVTRDREQTRYLLRMREQGLEESRGEVVSRLQASVGEHGFETVLTGGLFPLQGRMAELVQRSVVIGLMGLALIFAVLSFVVSRSLPVSLAMVVSFCAVPVFLMGALGYLGVPMDVIATPAATVAMAIGIDTMIHLVVRARRGREDFAYPWGVWLEARRDLWPAAAGSTLIISMGFALLLFSNLLPTRRLGLSVVLGTVMALALALITFPRLARWLTVRDASP
jgi:uncharacterized protein